MGTVVTVAGEFARPLGTLLPVMSGRQMWFNIGGSVDASAVNYADTGKPAAIIGSPVVHANYLALTGQDPVAVLQTQMPETPDLTLIAVAKNSAVLSSAISRIISSQVSGPYAALQFSSISTGGGITALAGNSGASNSVNLPIATSEWGLYSMRVESEVSIILTDHTVGKYTTATQAIGARTTGTSPFRIGAGYHANSNGARPDVAFAAGYNRALSTDEITAVVDRVRQLMAMKSITV